MKGLNAIVNDDRDGVINRYGLNAWLSAGLLWLAQPPLALWPLALIALVPWLSLIRDETRTDEDRSSSGHRDATGDRKTTGSRDANGHRYRRLWLVGFVYWSITLQGLRHAHPVMYLCWLALSAYLAAYLPLFLFVCQRLLSRGVSLWLAAPAVWVGCECLRNYLLTGISAVMLGHSMADVPQMIQIADLFGTYGVSFVLVSINVACWRLLQAALGMRPIRNSWPALAAGLALAFATLSYASVRLTESTDANQDAASPLAAFALIQRNETVEYVQDIERSVEIFQRYAAQSVESLRAAERPVDAVVWPESMFSGGAPWRTVDPNAPVAESLGMSAAELQENVRQQKSMYLDRANYVQSMLAAAQGSSSPPELIAGCGVVHYGDEAEVYSGVVHVSGEGTLADWYGKTHLVMFGEYVPIIPYLPGLRSLVPEGLGLRTGPGAKRFVVGETAVVPNICIETAVERVTINQVAELQRRGQSADVIVTVTNDGWFDDSSIIDHHLRCSQLVAVGCRRPILSAANNGPTAWIDSRGQLVQRLARGSNGAIIATPARETRQTLYVSIGDWPARLLAFICLVVLVECGYQRWRSLPAGKQAGERT